MMILFFADMDNTLIYSYKRDIGSDKIGVEFYPEKNQMISYMTKTSWKLLQKVAHKLLFIPTTTRTIEQYQRINLGFVPLYALVCNGGILLENGQENMRWYADSRELAAPAKKEIERASVLLKQDEYRSYPLKNIRDLVLFTKSNNPIKTVEQLHKSLDLSMVDVICNQAKVYVIPKKIDKGTACRRLKEKLYADCTIAAGDSVFDISMLAAADIALAPKWLCDAYDVKANGICDEEQQFFSEYILKYVLDYRTNFARI